MKVYNSVEELKPQFAYLEEQVNTLTLSMDRDGMERFANQEYYNSEMQEFLKDFKDDDEDESTAINAMTFSSLSTPMSMTYEAQFKKGNLKSKFKRLRNKLQRAFRTIIGDIDFGKIKTPEILSLVVSGIAASMNLVIAAVLLPLIVALVASLIKYGYSSVCPL